MAENTSRSHSTATDIPSWWPRRLTRVPDPVISAENYPTRSRPRLDGCSAFRQAAWAARVCAALLLGSCQALNPPREFKEADAATSAIRFDHSDFQPELAEYAVQKDPRTGGAVHLASFHGPDSSAVIAAIKAGNGYVVEERSPESMVSDLMPEEAEIDWGTRGSTMSGVGYTQYRLFRVVEQPLSCVGFAQYVGQSPDDRGRKRNAVFGYFCRDDSRPMTPQSAEEWLAQVKLTGGRGALAGSGQRRP
jgi:hypothetical protein